MLWRKIKQGWGKAVDFAVLNKVDRWALNEKVFFLVEIEGGV